MMLDSGKSVRKNQKIPNEISLYLENSLIAIAKIEAKKIRLANAGNSSKLFVI